jgi:hypothetical protein
MHTPLCNTARLHIFILLKYNEWELLALSINGLHPFSKLIVFRAMSLDFCPKPSSQAAKKISASAFINRKNIFRQEGS